MAKCLLPNIPSEMESYGKTQLNFLANPVSFYIGAVLRGDTFQGRGDTNKSESAPSSIQSGEVY